MRAGSESEHTRGGEREMAGAVARLSSRSAAQRAEAEEQLAALGDEAVQALIALLRREALTRRRTNRAAIAVLATLGAAFLVATLVGRAPDLTPYIGVFTSFSGAWYVSQTSKNAASRLAQFDDIRTVGALAEALDYQDKGVRSVVLPRLTALLPRLDERGAERFTAEQMAALRRVLKPQSAPAEVDLVVAALGALAVMGDTKALPPVLRLVAMDGAPSKADARIGEAAQRCAEALRQRTERDRLASTLLRAAAPPDDPAAVLVRPAEFGEDALLRPADQPPV